MFVFLCLYLPSALTATGRRGTPLGARNSVGGYMVVLPRAVGLDIGR